MMTSAETKVKTAITTQLALTPTVVSTVYVTADILEMVSHVLTMTNVQTTPIIVIQTPLMQIFQDLSHVAVIPDTVEIPTIAIEMPFAPIMLVFSAVRATPATLKMA